MSNQTYLPSSLPPPKPEPYGLDAEFWQAAAQGQLVIQRCSDCKTWRWGPEWICPHCHSFSSFYEPVAPEGTLYAYERVWHPAHPILKEATPYCVAVVELPHAGGVRMIGNLLGNPLDPPEIGARVKATFEINESDDAQYALVQWRVT